MDPVESDAAIADRAVDEITVPEPQEGLDEDDEERLQNRRDLLAGAVENGSSLAEDRRSPPFESDRDRPVRYEGAVYELSHTVVDDREVPRVEVSVDYNPTVPDRRAIEYADLSGPDREALSRLLPPPDYRDFDADDEGYDAIAGATYEDPTDSELVGDETVVVYEGERYLVRAERDGTTTLSDYRYKARQVAPDLESYGAELREEYAFTLSGLNESERAVVEQATNGSYYADTTDDAGFRGVVEAFREHDPVYSDGYSGAYLVRYDGQLYWAGLAYGEYAD
jgi:hypothetical protein